MLTDEYRYILENWPVGVPSDCTNQDAQARDCIEQRLSVAQQCLSCRTYDELWCKADPEVRKRR